MQQRFGDAGKEPLAPAAVAIGAGDEQSTVGRLANVEQRGGDVHLVAGRFLGPDAACIEKRHCLRHSRQAVAFLEQLLVGANAKTAFDPNELLDELKKAFAERALNAEMDAIRVAKAG